MLINQTLDSLFPMLDSSSDKIIKGSYLGRLVSFVKDKFNKPTFTNHKDLISNILWITQLLLLGLLFSSLALPQFSSNRFGIGIIIIFCTINLLANLLVNKAISIKFNLIDLLIIFFLLLIIASTFNSYFLKESIVGLYKYTLFIATYFILKITIDNLSINIFYGMWKFIFFLAIFVALIGVYQYIIHVEPLATWEDPNAISTHTRVYSTLGNPNLLAGFLLIFLPFGFYFANRSSLYSMKLIYYLSTLIVFLSIIFSGSRGGYVALITGLIITFAIFAFSKKKQKYNFTKLGLSLILSLILLLIFMFPIFKERIITIFELGNYSSNSFRMNVWSSCIQMLKDNFIFGIGPGNSTFIKAYSLYMKSTFDALSSYNIYLELAIQIGIFGLFIFLLLLLTSFLKLHHLFWKKGETFAFFIFLSLIFLMTHGLFDTVLFRPQIFIPFWFLLASIDKLEVYKNNG